MVAGRIPLSDPCSTPFLDHDLLGLPGVTRWVEREGWRICFCLDTLLSARALEYTGPGLG